MKPTATPSDRTDFPPEPLALSAPIALQTAPHLCRVDPRTGERCDWSHGLWQYLRLLGLVGSIEYHTDFYKQSLASVKITGRKPRVLISGAADYGLLARVIWAFRTRGIEPDITVIDLCETPLQVNRWYAARVDCQIATFACDILVHAPDAPFDAICADSFFGRFPPARRGALIGKWRELLRPGGSVIAVNRIRAPETGAHGQATADEPIRFSPAQALAFSDKVRRAAQRLFDTLESTPAGKGVPAGHSREPIAPQVDAEMLVQLAETYANRHLSWPVTSLGEIVALFESGGFRLDHAATAKTPAENPDIPGAPSVRGSATFAHLIAVRR